MKDKFTIQVTHRAVKNDVMQQERENLEFGFSENYLQV